MIISVIGYGYWGPNLVRNIIGNKSFTLKTICDINSERIDTAKKTYPQINFTQNPSDVITDNETDCIVIATNPDNHFELGMQALENNKHVLIEKPLSVNYVKAKELVEKAKSKNLILMTDLTYLYNGAVQKIDSFISSGELGTIQYIDSTRINLGIFQNDINVLGDLASHDLSIIYYLIQEKPISVSAIGKCHYNPYIENLSYLNLFYDSDLIVHIHCSWSAPVKVRQMIFGGNKKMLIYNDVEPTEKIKVYDASYELTEEDKDRILVDYRIGDVYIPKYNTREALNYMIEDFAEAIITGAKPLANTDISLQIMRTIHAANISMKENGKMVDL